MNELHLKFLASPEWAQFLETNLLPWLRDVGDLGDDVLEVGPGPGLTTDLLRTLTQKLTAVELDEQLAAALDKRLVDSNVKVVHGDASQTGFPANRFSAATCFSMLHHVPSEDIQDQLFAEIHRVLRPGGIFVGVDAVDNDAIRAGHVDDTFVPVDPKTLTGRLMEVGFTDITIENADYEIRFRTLKPLTS
jgi:ubiquinone/menaquinone biosynthesis C-methylase UbiE